VAKLYPLDNSVQHYDWGSPTRIHELLGTEPDGSPAAELWLGAHPSAPSWTFDGAVGAAPKSLLELVRTEPERVLGRRVADEFGPRLPYLFKVLAVERVLSLQVHPKPHAARAGFIRENRLGLPLESAKRSFKDDQHKPEMLVALTEFDALAGLRPTRTALSLLDGLSGRLLGEVRDELRADRSAAGVRSAFARLVAARSDGAGAAAVAEAVESVRERLAAGSPAPRADATVVRLAEQHPGDPGALAALLLNLVTLEPGQALFVPPGEVHAYVQGLCLEIMASSDNILRAGLTSKHVDEAALLECASFQPRPPTPPRTQIAGASGQVATYRAPVREFALTVADLGPGESAGLPGEGPRIVLSLEGAATLRTGDGTVHTLPRGGSCFVPHDAGELDVEGPGHVACAWVP
jgi:mannose-6-phosphate isomerase